MAPNPKIQAVLEAAARLQELVPDAVLVGGTAAAWHVGHRVSFDDDHVVVQLQDRFDQILAALEASEGWVTARIKRPVMILGSLDGVETGIRNLIRRRPLEVEAVPIGQRRLQVPTIEEITRVKAWLCLMRNATRDYIDLAALGHRLGTERAARILAGLDDYYEDQLGPGGLRVSTQVARQLAEPNPGDRSEVDLSSYRELDPMWHDWAAVIDVCRAIAMRVLDAQLGEA